MIAEQVVRIDVHKDRLIVRLKSVGTEEGSHSTADQLLSIAWQKPPSRKSRQILIPLGVSRNEVRPIRIERRARLVNAIARGGRWLDQIVSGSAANIEQIAARQKCSVRQVDMTISPAFLAPATGAMRGGIPFGRGALYYVLRNHFYIGEVEYKDEILPGEQPPIMDRALFDARAPARNGIFGCRDRGPKIAQQRPKFEK